MRKIEREMIAAIKSNSNWQSGNTSVQYICETSESKVFLHGNHIATVGETYVSLYDGGWQTNTTKSRLNAICGEFCIAGEGVFQHKFEWFVRIMTGAINGQKIYVTKPFESGVVFS